MANPRKFIEKIALHNQKQAEETAAFEKIMREVSDATNKGNVAKKQHLRIAHPQLLGTFRAGSLPNVNNMSQTTSIQIKSTLSNMEDQVQTGNMDLRERSRSTVGPMRSRPCEKRVDTSPYSGAYLSPPPDSNWRRTHSDSALHTSSQEQAHRISNEGILCEPNRRNMSASPDGRKRSEEIRIPGISVLPSQQETITVPMGNNTGSLPDLTSFHFPSPLNTPIDNDERNSSYNTTNYCNSPRTISSNRNHQYIANRFTFSGGTPPHEAPGPPHTPPHYITNDACNQTYQQYLYQPLSPTQLPLSPQNVSQQTQSLHSYRTPINRPSPQSSPSLTVKYQCSSPRSSSPQSPASPGSGICSYNEHNNYFINQAQANALQHHFEQISVDWCQLVQTLLEDNPEWSAHIQSDEGCTQISSHELTPDPGYFSTSPSQQIQYYTTRNQHPASTQTTPNTPSSIPDIVLTDFSNNDDLTKDLGVAMSGGLVDGDLFPTDECLREGLDPIDLDGLQMLTDPDMITDPATEDHFRLDRL